jgi:hypothetical protein
MCKTNKGITRQYRKALKRLSAPFPRAGIFHLARNGRVVEPADTLPSDEIVSGPVPAQRQEKMANGNGVDPTPVLIGQPFQEEQREPTEPPSAIPCAAPPPPPPSPPPLPTGPDFRDLDNKIDFLLRRRGFGSRVERNDGTFWSRTDDKYWRFAGELWSLSLLPEGVMQFGVDAALLGEVLARSLAMPTRLTPDRMTALVQQNSSLPDVIRQMQSVFNRYGRDYLAVRIGQTFGVMDVRELVAELIDAFAEYMTGGRVWISGSTGEGPGPVPGVVCVRTVPMPDPAKTPYHSFTLLARGITRLLRPLGYLPRIEKGSVSWDGPIASAGSGVGWKLCYQGERIWRFGVRKELVEANACLSLQRYDSQFHVLPLRSDTRPVFCGFLVSDRQVSHDRVKTVIDCLAAPHGKPGKAAS